MPESEVLTAVQSVYRAIEPLDEEARARVLQSVQVLLGMTAEEETQQTPVNEKTDSGTGNAGKVGGGDRRLSLVELVQQKNPGTIAQKIALYAYYREKHEGHPRFSRGDLELYFAVAHDKPPTNYDRDFVGAVTKGWIHEAGDDSYITTRGIEAVEGGFEGERKRRSGARKKTGAKKQASRRAKPVRKSTAKKSPSHKTTASKKSGAKSTRGR